MTSINASLYSGQYYGLPDKTSSVNVPSSTQSGSASTKTSNETDSGLDSINLSAEAQSYLNSLGLSGSASSTDNKAGFILNKQQQKQVVDILSKYKDEPYTQETYEKIQDDLKEAGLSLDQLAIKDQISSFNPTQLLIDALNGIYTTPENFRASQPDEQENSDTYMSNILRQWEAISTTAGDEGDTSEPAAVA